MEDTLDILLIVCTYNRAESLRELLGCLAKTDRENLAIEVVVVDNNSTDNTADVVRSFEDRLQLRYLFEPVQGKSHALNRALDECEPGKIVAFLDDDMSPDPGWFKGVAALCARWPDCDVFSGKSYVIWPVNELPGWALRGCLTWVFSVLNLGDKDRAILNDRVPFPSGNSFWIRARVLKNGHRFEHLWLTEPMFLMQLAEEGYKGVYGPDAVTGHRIQPPFLSEEVVRARAIQLGRGLPHVRLLFPNAGKQAALFKRHPILWWILCAANLMRWSFCYIRGHFNRSYDERFSRTTLALLGISNNIEILCNARKIAKERNKREAIRQHFS